MADPEDDATLYGVGLPTINEHIKKIYADSELEESATIRNFRIVQTEGINCIFLSGLDRGPCRTSYSDDDGGLGKASGLIPDG